jgi:23S rRNA (cytosine1962-C5)-methyltransferase
MPKPKSPKAPHAPARPSQKPSSPYQARAGQARRDQAPRPVAEPPQPKPAFSKPPSIHSQRPKRTSPRPPDSRSAAPKPTPYAIAAQTQATQKLNIPAPYAQVSRRASDNLRRGHLWVYSSEIEQLEPGPNSGSTAAPALIPVVDSRGLLLGTALFSPASQIALRLVSRDLIDDAQWLTLLASRLRAAILRRSHLLNAGNDACRLVFSEADQLPGIIVDRYAGIVVLQLLARGLDSAQVREVCTQNLREELLQPGSDLTIWERPDPRIRELEGLSAPSPTPLFTTSPAAPLTSTVFHLNGLSFHFDVNSGQKTGAFLDQRENYAAAASWAKAKGATGKALDVCTYQGGFALHLAQVCSTVTGVDASRSSLEVAERNLELNRRDMGAPGLASETWESEVDWIEADAFELLRALSEPQSGSEATREWDLIVLDPPAFAKSRRAVEGALRGYKELNLRALRMLRPGGLLVTCSCSHHVSWTDLETVLADAAVDAHRRVTLLERRGAAQDHPVVLNLPETEYLKCLICQVE